MRLKFPLKTKHAQKEQSMTYNVRSTNNLSSGVANQQIDSSEWFN